MYAHSTRRTQRRRKGGALKRLDDTLDGLICALAAWLAWRNPCAWETIGDHAGYIIVLRER